MIYGYARVSTVGQVRDGNSLEAQSEALKAAGATEIYYDAYTGKKKHRPQFDELMKKQRYSIPVTAKKSLTTKIFGTIKMLKADLNERIFFPVHWVGKTNQTICFYSALNVTFYPLTQIIPTTF